MTDLEDQQVRLRISPSIPEDLVLESLAALAFQALEPAIVGVDCMLQNCYHMFPVSLCLIGFSMIKAFAIYSIYFMIC